MLASLIASSALVSATPLPPVKDKGLQVRLLPSFVKQYQKELTEIPTCVIAVDAKNYCEPGFKLSSKQATRIFDLLGPHGYCNALIADNLRKMCLEEYPGGKKRIPKTAAAQSPQQDWGSLVLRQCVAEALNGGGTTVPECAAREVANLKRGDPIGHGRSFHDQDILPRY